MLNSLRTSRGRGRDLYPVSVLWGVVLLTVALRHPTTQACWAELKRNEGLRLLIGTESEAAVPPKWNDGHSKIVYDEVGSMFCDDQVSTPTVQHQMSYIGYESERETIRYRCPAKREGFSLPNERCLQRRQILRVEGAGSTRDRRLKSRPFYRKP